MKRNKIQQRILLKQIKDVRFFLPFHKALEFNFYDTLVSSYRNRRLVLNKKTDTYRLVGDVGSATDSAFALIGLSGCGKSSAIKSVTSHYPQTIIHETEKGEMAQILYIVVSCMPNSNFRALYATIGKAIDDALQINLYEEMLSRKRYSLAELQQLLTSLIETYAIGMIIFDEIQLMNFSSTKEASFETLLTLANQTKVAINIVGTNDSYDKILKHPRTVRRIGTFIDASFYCNSKKYASAYVLSTLSKYQLVKNEMVINDDLIEAFYKETNGIVSLMVSLFIAVQDDYIENDLKGPINGDYVVKVSKKYYPKIRQILKKGPEYDKQISILLHEVELTDKRQLEELMQRSTIEQTIKNKDDTDISDYVEIVTESITKVTDKFPVKKIQATIKAVVGNTKKEDIDVDALCMAVFKKLDESHNKVTPKISEEEMIKQIQQCSQK